MSGLHGYLAFVLRHMLVHVEAMRYLLQKPVHRASTASVDRLFLRENTARILSNIFESSSSNFSPKF